MKQLSKTGRIEAAREYLKHVKDVSAYIDEEHLGDCLADDYNQKDFAPGDDEHLEIPPHETKSGNPVTLDIRPAWVEDAPE